MCIYLSTQLLKLANEYWLVQVEILGTLGELDFSVLSYLEKQSMEAPQGPLVNSVPRTVLYTPPTLFSSRTSDRTTVSGIRSLHGKTVVCYLNSIAPVF